METVSFKLEWFDELAAMPKPFKLIFWIEEGTIQIIDMKSQKLFLKKIRTEVTLDHLFIGNKLQIYGREFKVVDYGDLSTK